MKPRLTVWIILILSSIFCQAEGTKQLRPDSVKMVEMWIHHGSGYGCFGLASCPPEQSLFVHIAHPGEKLFMGFQETQLTSFSFSIKLNGATVSSWYVDFQPGSPGYIRYYSQAVAGPDILDPHGYHAITFTPAVAGDYCIVFGQADLYLGLFDFTVIDTTQTPLAAIDGRIWSQDWSFEANAHFIGTMHILSTDSIVTSVDFNFMFGMLFDVTSTSNGCFPPPASWDSSCKSHKYNRHYAEYKLFVNDPDSIEYPTGTMGVILGDTVNVARGCDGSFTFSFIVNKPGKVQLNIETNLAPGIQPEDLILTSPVQAGVINTIFWNGLNGLGDSIPCGDSVGFKINYINGLTNLAMFDVEEHLNGFIIELVRPPGPPIATYWNDTLLHEYGGQVQLDGCYAVPPDQGCHTWTTSSWMGEGNTINTWWYAASSILDLGRFQVACVPHKPQGILGPLNLCASSIATYMVNPNPITGSDLYGYEWVLTDAATGEVLFDSVGIGATVKIHFSVYPPGQKRLKVRGGSAYCGMGPFGPGASGEGILINPLLTTQVNNIQHSFTLCSGDTTDITLSASLPGTTFSYTANSSSPAITGFSSGTQNPVKQVLVNAGTSSDTVFYHVVPYLDPCPGDTATFMVVVNPSGIMNFLIEASSNPVCMAVVDTFSVTELIGGPNASYQWYVNGNPAGPDLPSFWYVPSDGDTVHCIVQSPDFCTPGKIANSQDIILNVLTPVVVEVTLNPPLLPVCQGDTIGITAVPVNEGSHPSYQWFVNGAVAGTNSSNFTFVPGNGDQVVCILTSDLSCIVNNEASDTLVIITTDTHRVVDTTLCYGTPFYAGGEWQTAGGIYYDTLGTPVSCIRFIETHLSYKPPIQIELGNDTILCDNNITLKAKIPGGTYVWQDGSTDSVYIVTIPGKYKVLVSFEGCVGSDSIKIGECPVLIWFPNAFTPNGDGLNDTFHPVGNGIEKFSMQIFNRWGTMLFESSSPDVGWDGTYKGVLCIEDTYVFQASFEISSGEARKVTGTIVLQRKQ